MQVFRSEIAVTDPLGLHARPAGQLVKLAQQSESEILVGTSEGELKRITGPLALLAMKVRSGDHLVFEVHALHQAQAEQVIGQIQQILKGSN